MIQRLLLLALTAWMPLGTKISPHSKRQVMPHISRLTVTNWQRISSIFLKTNNFFKEMTKWTIFHNFSILFWNKCIFPTRCYQLFSSLNCFLPSLPLSSIFLCPLWRLFYWEVENSIHTHKHTHTHTHKHTHTHTHNMSRFKFCKIVLVLTSELPQDRLQTLIALMLQFHKYFWNSPFGSTILRI